MDDLLIRFDRTEEAIRMHEEIINIFIDASMNVREWESTDPAVTTSFKYSISSQEQTLCASSRTLKGLELSWNTDNDSFFFHPVSILHFISQLQVTKQFRSESCGKILWPLKSHVSLSCESKYIFARPLENESRMAWNFTILSSGNMGKMKSRSRSASRLQHPHIFEHRNGKSDLRNESTHLFRRKRMSIRSSWLRMYVWSYEQRL